MARKMHAYGEREQNGRHILDDYCFSRNHTKAVTVRRWKRDLKKKARQRCRGIGRPHTAKGRDGTMQVKLFGHIIT